MSIDDICYEELQFEKRAETHEALVYGESITGQCRAVYVGEIDYGDKKSVGMAVIEEEKTRKQIAKHKINIIYAGIHPTPEKTLEHVLKIAKTYAEHTYADEQPTEQFRTTITRLTYSLHSAIKTGNFEKELKLLVTYTEGTAYTDDIYRLVAHLFSTTPEETIINTLIEKIIARNEGNENEAQKIHQKLPETVQKLPATAK